MRYLQLSFFLLQTTIGFAQDKSKEEIGIGIISINYISNGQEDSIVKFYKSAESKKTVHRYKLGTLDEKLSMGNTKLAVNPLEFMPTPGRIILRCIDTTKKMYKVVINENTLEVCWIKKNLNIEFSNWLAYFEGCDYVVTDVPLRINPDDNASLVADPDSCFSYNILNMQGDWIELTTSSYCDIYNNKPDRKNITGWTKWREGHQLLIGKTYAE